jgi:hypothetical protein
MTKTNRSRIAGGILMILLGAWFLAVQYIPGLGSWLPAQFSWPFYVIGAGLAMLLLGLVVGAPGMAVPGCIVTGIGGILYYQFTTGDWQSWAYAWALIPGFVGLGVIISETLEGHAREGLNSGLRLVFISAVLFVIFGGFLGNLDSLGTWWPAILIAGGLYLVARSLIQRRGR